MMEVPHSSYSCLDTHISWKEPSDATLNTSCLQKMVNDTHAMQSLVSKDMDKVDKKNNGTDISNSRYGTVHTKSWQLNPTHSRTFASITYATYTAAQAHTSTRTHRLWSLPAMGTARARWRPPRPCESWSSPARRPGTSAAPLQLHTQYARYEYASVHE